MSTILLNCRQYGTLIRLQVKRAIDNRQYALSITFYRELGFVRVGSAVDRPLGLAVNIILSLGESEQVSEFVSDLNLEFLVFFS